MFKASFAAALALLAVSATGAVAQVGADLNISPRRVTFDPTDRSATVYVFNQGDTAATYSVELIDRVMLTDGQIIAAADAAQAPTSPSARSLIDYTPRRVTLQPKQSQVIRIRVRPPAETAPEYRTHLTVTALPPEDSGFTAAQAAAGAEDGVSLQVTALFSVSIPLIVRQGDMDARAAIENVSLVSGGPGPTGATSQAVQLDLVRLGANSVYGDVEIHAGEGASDHIVGLVKGVAVYPEIGRRTLTAPLAEPVPAGEPLRIVYRDDDAKVGEVLATASLPGS
jgi:P pilus assembly chaperone PapD